MNRLLQYVLLSISIMISFVGCNKKTEPSGPDGGNMLTVTDSQYNYAFQVPSTWEFIRKPTLTDDIRFEVKTHNSSTVMITVGKLGTAYRGGTNKETSDALVDQMSKWTISKVYRKSYTDVGVNPSEIKVLEKNNLTTGNDIQFVISTVALSKVAPIVIRGIHTIPYNTDRLISMIVIISSKNDDEELTRVLNSFHLTK